VNIIQAAFISLLALAMGQAQPGAVKVREEALALPTYQAAPPETTPIFYEGRTYQGAKGPIYPYPIVDRLSDNRQEKRYKAVYLENEYIRICVLPELGGRIFEGVDKTNGYNFFYRQHVVKPGLIGMVGAWISGGVEWNIPHHHRASSFMPVPHRVEEGADGSKTVWFGEMELRHRMRWVMGLTVRPGKAYVEATLRLFNRTPLTHSFLYFANVAVHANDQYQVIFPPSTHVATQHSKVEFSDWPVSRQLYGGADFRKGVDVSWWKNHEDARSMFAFDSREDFLAGYDHGRQAGTMHVAEHGIMPGKKFFTWGTGSYGQAWDRALTDTDGPYLELMVGGYSDNQPDYSWIQPYEVKTLTEFWYPFRNIGGVKNANLQAAVNLEVKGGVAKVGFNSTEAHERARVLVEVKGKPAFDQVVEISPGKPFSREVTLPAETRAEEVKASLWVDGKALISYQPEAAATSGQLPPPVEAPPAAERIKTNDELYLTGLRQEQFYSPAREPDPYYAEALKRDPGDARANTAMGLLCLRRGMPAEAERHFRAAIARLTKNYTRPRDGEALYYLGVALTSQGKYREAEEEFSQAGWSLAWHSASNFALAQLSTRARDFGQALLYADRSLSTNAGNPKALTLKAAILRHLGRKDEAAGVLAAALRLDPLDVWPKYEQTASGLAPKQQLKDLATPSDELQPHLEAAVDYLHSGLLDESIAVLTDLAAAYKDQSRVYPMVYYYLAYLNEEAGRERRAGEFYALAARMPADYCFPFRMESLRVLRRAIERNPRDASAQYYLGNLLYDVQPDAALGAWEAAAKLNPKLAMAQRNLAFGYARKRNDTAKAIQAMESAVQAEVNPRFLLELDQLYEAGGAPVAKRLALFERNPAAAAGRDDTLSREIYVRVQSGQYDKALALLSGRRFHIWEGANITVHNTYVDAHLLRGHRAMKAGRFAEALKDYQAALEYPENLGEGKPRTGDRSPAIYQQMATAYAALGDQARAQEMFRKCVDESADRSDAEVRFARAVALKKLGKSDEAARELEQMKASGKRVLEQGADVDHFAKFGGNSSVQAVRAEAHFALALAHLGGGEPAAAKQEFEQVVQLNSNHLWARYYLGD